MTLCYLKQGHRVKGDRGSPAISKKQTLANLHVTLSIITPLFRLVYIVCEGSEVHATYVEKYWVCFNSPDSKQFKQTQSLFFMSQKEGQAISCGLGHPFHARELRGERGLSDKREFTSSFLTPETKAIAETESGCLCHFCNIIMTDHRQPCKPIALCNRKQKIHLFHTYYNRSITIFIPFIQSKI